MIYLLYEISTETKCYSPDSNQKHKKLTLNHMNEGETHWVSGNNPTSSVASLGNAKS